MPPHADLVFMNGPVRTMTSTAAEAVAVTGDRITVVGSRADVDAVTGPGTRVVDLAGRALVPGFVDAHTHFVQFGVRLLRLDLARATDRDDLLQRVSERARLTPDDGWVVGHSWDESKWPEGERPTRDDLDRVAPGHPVLLARVDRHVGVLNTLGLTTLGFDPAEHPDGALYEDTFYAAAAQVEPSIDTLAKAVRQATRHAWRLGVTSAHVIASREDTAALRLARDDGGLGVRVTIFHHLGAVDHGLERGRKRGDGDAWLRVNGIKLYADGSIGARTAAVATPYEDGGNGVLTYDDETLKELVARADAAGLQVCVHAIGERAVTQALDALAATPDPGAARHRVEHAELTTDADAARFAALGVVASMQPNFIGEWGHPGQMYEARLGAAVVARHNRFKTFWDAGVKVAFGSDDMPLGPLYGVHCAVNAPSDAQRLDVDAALAAYTTGAAYAGFAEHEVGAIAPGYLADLVVLSGDPAAAPHRIKDLRVALTVVDGRVVYEESAVPSPTGGARA